MVLGFVVYGTTKADEMLSGAIMFHYWMVRASALYARHVLTNPALMAGYYRMAQYMEREREKGGVPEWLDNMVKVMTGAYGYDIFANPVAMLETFLFFGGGRFGKGFVDEDANAFWRFMQNTGFMPAAPLAAALVITGNGGSDRVPDPIGISALTRPSTVVLNALAAHGFIDPDDASIWTGDGGVFTDPTEESLNFLRTVATRYLPWVDTIPDPVASDMYHREINEQILTIAQERGLISDDIAERARAAEGIDQTLPAVVLEAINNPDSDLWQEAFRRVALSDLALEGLRANPVTGVTYPYARPTIRGERDAQYDTLPEGSPERQQLYNEAALTNTVTEAGRDLTAADQTYRFLGDPAQRKAYQSWVDIAYGDDWQGFYKIGSQRYRLADLQGMSDDQRQRAADQWARETGNTEMIEQLRETRDAFGEGSPEYAAYQEWKRQVYDYEGGPVAYWQEITGYNQNAEWWFDHLRDDQQGSEGALTSIDAYMAFTGTRGGYKTPEALPLDDPTQRPHDPAAPQGGTGAESSGYAPGTIKPEWIVEDIAEYQQEVAEYNATLRELFPNEPVNIEMLQPNVRSAVIQNVYDRTGQAPPELSSRAEQYLVWAREQEPGSDTSIEAWLAWRGQQEEAIPTNATVTLSDGSVVDPTQYIGSLDLP